MEGASNRFSGGSSQFSFVTEDTQLLSESSPRADTITSVESPSSSPLGPNSLHDLPTLNPICADPRAPTKLWQLPERPNEKINSAERAIDLMHVDPTATGLPYVTQNGYDGAISGEYSDPFADPKEPLSIGASRHDSVSMIVRGDSVNPLKRTISQSTSISSVSTSTAMTSVSSNSAVIIDTIKRMFVPRRKDELPIARGDRVRVLYQFKDQWLYVEKMGTALVGFIPQDCLRAVDEPLPQYLIQGLISYDALVT